MEGDRDVICFVTMFLYIICNDMLVTGYVLICLWRNSM